MNFKHLKYFWTVAKAGGVVRAGEQLHTTPQTLSGQIKQLEQWCVFRTNVTGDFGIVTEDSGPS